MKRLITLLSLVILFGVSSALESGIQPSDVIDKVNFVREIKGLSELQYSQLLTDIAQDHCNYLYKTKIYAHDRPNLTVKARYNKRLKGSSIMRWGENLAERYDTDIDVVIARWNSPLHKKVLVNPIYQYIGIAVKGEVTCMTVADKGK